MFKRILASIVTASAIVPLMWFSVAPNGVAYCGAKPYSVTRENSVYKGQMDTLVYSGSAAFCELVKEFPAPSAS